MIAFIREEERTVENIRICFVSGPHQGEAIRVPMKFKDTFKKEYILEYDGEWYQVLVMADGQRRAKIIPAVE